MTKQNIERNTHIHIRYCKVSREPCFEWLRDGYKILQPDLRLETEELFGKYGNGI